MPRKMRYEIFGLGRGRFNGSVVGTEHDLYGLLAEHLLSSCFEVIWNGERGSVVVGGWRDVGTVFRVEA